MSITKIETGPNSSEDRLRSTIAILEKQILTMVAIRDHMRRLLSAQNANPEDQRQRSNSIDKQIISDHILNELRQSARLSTQELFRRIQLSAPMLKYVTFRSHLHRLKKQNLVANMKSGYGGWRIVTRDLKQDV